LNDEGFCLPWNPVLFLRYAVRAYSRDRSPLGAFAPPRALKNTVQDSMAGTTLLMILESKKLFN